MRLILVAICLYMIFGYSAFGRGATSGARDSASATSGAPGLAAANAASNISATPAITTKTPFKSLFGEKFGLTLDLSYTSDRRPIEESGASTYNSLNIVPIYQIHKDYSLLADFAVEQKISDNNNIELSDIRLIVRREEMAIDKYHKISPAFYSDLPTNEKSRTEESFRGGLGASILLARDYYLLGQTGRLSLGTSLLKQFHEYDRESINRSANLSHRIRQTVRWEQNLTKRLSIDILGFYQAGWTYQNVDRNTFRSAQAVLLQVTDEDSVYLKHTNEGPTTEANGVDSNIKLYNDVSSYFAVGVKAQF